MTDAFRGDEWTLAYVEGKGKAGGTDIFGVEVKSETLCPRDALSDSLRVWQYCWECCAVVCMENEKCSSARRSDDFRS